MGFETSGAASTGLLIEIGTDGLGWDVASCTGVEGPAGDDLADWGVVTGTGVLDGLGLFDTVACSLARRFRRI